KFTLLQNLMASHYRKMQLFFIQPNPHLVEMKILSEEEKTYVKDVSKDPNDSSALQYRKLLDSAKAVKSRGVTVYDMTPVFSGVSQTVYVDDCCHLNENGKLILGRAMAPAIVDAIVKKARGG
ncbi:MAG: hypothetical protein K2P92_06995, partial [Bdellovibrionaceae bacterium]|nr:hypothetical protein [Pseudobdellovibrionaceae bacterium]